MENKERIALPTHTTPLESLRSRLGKLSDRIIFRLQDRASLPLNPSVYKPDGVPVTGKPGMSLLDLSIQGLEGYHATLGRYDYPDQYPIVDSGLPRAMITREAVEDHTFPQVDINLKDRLVPFYKDTILPQLCEPKDDPNTYGEAVFLDADVLELMNERINIGRFVARSKVTNDPGLWSIVDDKNQLLGKLRDNAQEDRVIKSITSAADKYGLNKDRAEEVFRWVIEETIGLEVTYLQRVAALRGKTE